MANRRLHTNKTLDLCGMCGYSFHMLTNKNTEIPAWQAYGDLFTLVRDRQKPKWSLDDLVDAIKEDADAKNRPKCKCSARSLEGYQTNPIKEKSKRHPLPHRQEHLYEFLRAELERLGEIEKYAAHLAAIAPPETTSLSLSSKIKNIFEGKYEAGIHDVSENPANQLRDYGRTGAFGLVDSSTVSLEQVIQVIRELFKQQSAAPKPDNLTAGNNNENLAKKLSGIAPGVFLGHANQQTVSSVGGGMDSLQILYNQAMEEFLGDNFGESGRLFQQLAQKMLNGPEALRTQSDNMEFTITEILLLAGISYFAKKRFDQGLTLLARVIEKAEREGDMNLRTIAELQNIFGFMNSIVALISVGEKKNKHSECEIAAYRKALIFYNNENFHSEWFGIQNNLGNALSCQAKMSSAEVASNLMSEATDVFRTLLKHHIGIKEHCSASIALANALISRSAFGYTNGWPRNSINSLVQEAKEVLTPPLKLVTRKKHPNLWLEVQVCIVNGLLLQNIFAICDKETDEAMMKTAERTLPKLKQRCRNAQKYVNPRTAPWVEDALNHIIASIEAILSTKVLVPG